MLTAGRWGPSVGADPRTSQHQSGPSSAASDGNQGTSAYMTGTPGSCVELRRRRSRIAGHPSSTVTGFVAAPSPPASLTPSALFACELPPIALREPLPARALPAGPGALWWARSSSSSSSLSPGPRGQGLNVKKGSFPKVRPG